MDTTILEDDKSNLSVSNNRQEEKYYLKACTNLNEFEDLRLLWDRIASKQEVYMPFFSYAWFKLWIQEFLKNDELLILVLYRGDEIKAIAPFLVKTEKYKGIQIRKIDLIGNVYSPVRYFLLNGVALHEKKQIITLFLNYFYEIYKDWDLIDLYAIPEENTYFENLENVVKESCLKFNTYFCFGNWYLDKINYSFDEYLKSRSSNISKNVPYRLRRLSKIGKLDFKLIMDGKDIDYYMDIYYELYSKSWQKREGIGPDFHRKLAKLAAEKGWLRLGFLLLDGLPIACQFWITAGEDAYILKLFYDQDYQQYAPGKILTYKMMEHVINNDRVKTIDYLHGDEDYKREWMSERRERKGILIYNDTAKAQYLYLLNNKIMPFIRRHESLNKIKKTIFTKLKTLKS